MNIVSISRTAEQTLVWLTGIILVSLAIILYCHHQHQLFPVGTRVDFGDISIGQTTEKAFAISNHSATAIAIVGWAPTCHCVAARFSQTLVPPGGSISGYVQTSATTPLGKRAVMISIQWHYVGENEVRTDNLVVSARYVSPLLFSEDRLDFANVRYGEAQKMSLQVAAGNAAGIWDNLEVSSNSDRLSARVAVGPAGFRIESRIDPSGLPGGVWKSTLKVYPLLKGKRTGQEISLPVVARIEGPFSTTPPVLQFFEQHNRGLSFLLKVHSSTVAIRRLSLLGNVIQDPKIKISTDGKEATISGSLARPVNKGMFVGKIPFQINDGPEGALDVSFIGYPG